MKKPAKKRTIIASVSLVFAFFGYATISFNASGKDTRLQNDVRQVEIIDGNLDITLETSAPSIEALLKERSIVLAEHDETYPAKNSPIAPGLKIYIRRAIPITLQVDSKNITTFTTAKTVRSVLSENDVLLNRLDKVVPDVDSSPKIKTTIIVTRINEEEKTIAEDIAFKTITNTDPQMGWHDQTVTQVGVKGIQETKYRITYKNGQEVSRVTLEKNIIQQPTPQIVTQGTYMQLGKADKGQGTWYSFKGGLFAASTSLPRGSYARVTNLANGKSVVVQINDYGPFGKGRIIDLDKVAFSKIAPIGAGIIGVKVEAILN